MLSKNYIIVLFFKRYYNLEYVIIFNLKYSIREYNIIIILKKIQYKIIKRKRSTKNY